jgi:hypothetical protein
MTSLYPSEISQYKLRAAGCALFKLVDSAFGLVFSFAMSFAMADLSWKFYFINGAWDIVFCALIYFFFVETKGLKLEEIAIKFEGPQILEEVAISQEHDAAEKKGALQEDVKE